MIITRITPQDDPLRVNVFIDDSFAFGLSIELKFELNLFEGKEISQTEVLDILNMEEVKKAKNYAYSYLSYRQRSKHEMVTYLENKEFSTNAINEVIIILEDQKLLDDMVFSRMYLEEKTTLNYLGPHRLKYELQQKGIDKKIIDEVLEDYSPDLEDLKRIVLRKFSTVLKEGNVKQYSKIGGYLQRKGHSYETIKQILKELSEEGE